MRHKDSNFTHNRKDQKLLRRELRQEATPAEAVLWTLLKGRQIDGFRWRRQFSVGPYILDFYCPQARLCVELDGNDHFTHEGAEHDTIRTRYLEREHGIRTLRFENRAVWESTAVLLDVITEALHTSCNNPE